MLLMLASLSDWGGLSLCTWYAGWSHAYPVFPHILTPCHHSLFSWCCWSGTLLSRLVMFFTFFGGSCFVWLHHCCHTSGDHVLLVTPIHGLLYSELLVPPLTPTDHAYPWPHPKLHVQQLVLSSPLTCPCDGSGEGSCSACSLLMVAPVSASCPHCFREAFAVGSGKGLAVGSASVKKPSNL